MLGHVALAIAAQEKARAILRPLTEAYPGIQSFQGALALSENSTAVVLIEAGQSAEALAAFQRAMAIRQDTLRRQSQLPAISDGSHRRARQRRSDAQVDRPRRKRLCSWSKLRRRCADCQWRLPIRPDPSQPRAILSRYRCTSRGFSAVTSDR